MILYNGIDIVKNDRIEHLINKYGNVFLNRIYIKEEIELCNLRKNPVPSFAVRFALKEAFFKCLPLSIQKELYSFHSIGAVYDNSKQKPISVLSEKANTLLNKEIPKFSIQFSMSHEKEYSIAQVMIFSSLSLTNS